MSYRIDQVMNGIECILNEAAYYPVLSTFSGGIRVALGAIQTTAAVALSVFSLYKYVANGESDLLRYSWTHIQNGVANILLGAIEMIPFAGMVIYKIRENKKAQHEALPTSINTSCEEKWVRYPSVVHRNWRYSGTRSQDITLLNQEYNRRYNSRETPPLETRYETAKEILENHILQRNQPAPRRHSSALF